MYAIYLRTIIVTTKEEHQAQRDTQSGARQDHIRSNGTMSVSYNSNAIGTSSWIEHLQSLPGPPSDNVPLIWIEHMLQSKREARWSAHTLSEHIQNINDDSDAPLRSLDYVVHTTMTLQRVSTRSRAKISQILHFT